MKTAKRVYPLSLQYFLFFGVMGIYLPYFNLYCYHLGFSESRIGILSSARSVTLVLFPLVWGWLADRFVARKQMFVICNIVSSGIWALLLFTRDFYPMLLITVCYGVFYAPIISFMEAFTMDALGGEKRGYGKVRVWGSISFIGMTVALGRIIDVFSAEIIVILIFAGSSLQALFSFIVPGNSSTAMPSFSGIRPLMERRVVFFLFCAFLMLASHGAYYGFFSIHLEKLGFSNTFVGIAWALASLSEILVMLNSDRIFRRFAAEKILFFSFVTAALRWAVLVFAVSPVAILLTQILHAFTYGAFHVASILYMDSLMPEDAKTTGQAANNAVTYGLGLMVGFSAGGYMFEIAGPAAMFVASCVTAATGGYLIRRLY